MGVRREIIVDSGASKHMIGINQLKASEKESIREVSVPFFFRLPMALFLANKRPRFTFAT